MKTISLFLIWILSYAAWKLARFIGDDAARFEPLLDDASAMSETDAKESLCDVVSHIGKAIA